MTRDEALALAGACGILEHAKCENVFIATASDLYKFANKIIESHAAAQPASPWVEITPETLPPEDEFLVLAFDGGDVEPSLVWRMFTFEKSSGHYLDVNEEPFQYSPTHYMIVEPPK